MPAEDTSNQQHGQSGGFLATLAGALNSFYGPYAFGLISALVLWLVMAKPELDRLNRQDQNSLQCAQTLLQLSQQLGMISQTTEATAASLAATAITLERTVDRLDKLEEDRRDRR